jgi:secreted PhoX family phosphatase
MAHHIHHPAHPTRRRALLTTAGLGALGAAALVGGPPLPALAAPLTDSRPAFSPVPVGREDAVTVARGYTVRVLAPWGGPLASNSPRWRPDASDTAADALRQVGTGHGGAQYLPLSPAHEGNRRGLLVLSHATADPVLLHADGGRAATAERAAKEMASLGVTVLRVELSEGRWRVRGDELNRRLTPATPVAFSGPLAGHAALDTGADAQGVLGGFAHAATPWGTFLTGEDTIADAFGTEERRWRPSPAQERYGLAADASAYGWHAHHPRFDLARTPKEAHRFGWTVEVDPFAPEAAPVKRTALGRLAARGAAVTESRGHAVVYLCDDTHVYKFVTARPWRRMRGATAGPLDEGTLYAARLDKNGTGVWLPLEHGRANLRTGFEDQADVLLRAREAADAVGATALRRPGRPAVHPGTGTVYCPESEGADGGRVLAWTEGAGDHGAAVMSWREFLRPGRETDPDGAAFGAPGGVHCGADGRLWITTDAAGAADRGRRERPGNSALLCADPETGEVRRFLTGPPGCAVSGVGSTPDQGTLFVTVHGPGSAGPDGDDDGPTGQDPRAVSNWPGFDPRGRPRSAVVVVQRRDGGRVGT